MSTDVARGHGGDGGGDDRPPSHHIPTGCGGCFANRGKGTRKANLGGRKAGRLHTRQETRNLGLKKITDDKGPVLIRFEWDDKKTMMPLGDINDGQSAALQKLYNTNKASLKAAHWVINPETGTYDVETIRQGRPESITPADWDAQIAFWNDPRNQARAAQNRQNRAKSTVVCRQGSRSLARLRDEMMASSETREYPSLIDTFFVTHTVNGVFIRDEDRAIYRALAHNTESGVPYTDEEINAMARKGKQRGHLPGVGRVLPGRARDVLIPPPPPPPQCTHNSGEKVESTPEFGSGSGGCGDDEIADDEDGGEDEEDEEDDDIFAKKEFDMKELGEAKKILGMEIIRDQSRKILRVSQSGYVSKILNNFRIDNGKSVQMPLGGHFKLSLKDCPVRDSDVERMSKVPYANAVRSLMYLMVCMMPDIAYAVSVVSRYLANLSKKSLGSSEVDFEIFAGHCKRGIGVWDISWKPWMCCKLEGNATTRGGSFNYRGGVYGLYEGCEGSYLAKGTLERVGRRTKHCGS
ncbi:reverse transcriptase domain-containing protein [Tanacetum coccineum]